MRTLNLLSLTLLPAALWAQAFTGSGSNGSDGDLNFANVAPNATVIFDPKDKVMFPPNGLDVDGDNIYHFKSITIPAGITVKLTSAKLPGPVYWLSQGDVRILGMLNLDGQSGTQAPAGSLPQPGPGGFAGGSGNPPTPGFGPGGGAKGGGSAYPCPSSSNVGSGGSNNFGDFLVPLIGGSGGGSSGNGLPGGAGGGAILIASSTSIALPSTGGIFARGGGSGSDAGYGAGGAIRLVARTINFGGGTLDAGSPSASTDTRCYYANNGTVRTEFLTSTGGSPVIGRYLSGAPIDTYLPLPSSNPSLRLVSVGNIPVNPSPSGSFDIPDVTINSGDPVPVVVETTNVPVGTVIRMYVYSQNGSALTLDFPPLAGTGSTLTATASTKFPYGFSRSTVRLQLTR